MAKKKKTSHQNAQSEEQKAHENHETQETHEMHEDDSASESVSSEAMDSKKVHLDFYGSEILRQKAPQAFELAEAVADDWVNNGNFQKLPLNHPFAQLVSAVSLQSAKKVEKKLEEKGVISMAKMGLEYAKTKWPLKEKKND
jgi:hypothetical protein